MLKDADPEYFSGIYIVCGYTDLRYGIDSLAAILERKFHAKLFVPNTLFLFCGRSASKIKGLLWEGDGFLLLYKRVESGHFTWPHSSFRRSAPQMEHTARSTAQPTLTSRLMPESISSIILSFCGLFGM